MTLKVQALAEQRLDRFQCGVPDLDDWLQRHAMQASGHGTRTYVLVEQDDVVGYFAISPHFLQRDDAPRNIGRGSPQQIPAILLGKLALDESLQGQGLGTELLIFALRTIIQAARVAGGRLVVVDAIDEAARRFYEHHDFQKLPGNERRLVLKLSTAARALEMDWP